MSSTFFTLATAFFALMPQAAPNVPGGEPTVEKKLCRTMTATGSIMPKRACKSSAQWKKFDYIAGADAQRAMDRRTAGMNFNNGGSYQDNS